MAYVYHNGSLGRARALGDAAYDQAYAKYLSDHAAWEQSLNVYRSALASWQAGEANKGKIYAQDKAAYSAYLTARATAQSTWSILKLRLARQGVSVPSDFIGCVSQAQRDAWQVSCDQLNAVKGLGSVPTGNACLLKPTPICPAPVSAPVQPSPAPAPTPPGPEPQPPVKPATPPPPPPPPVQAQIPTPVQAQIPATNIPASITPNGGGGGGSTPTTDSTVPVAATKSGGLLSSGLILLVVAGGGYALYRTFKKPARS